MSRLKSKQIRALGKVLFICYLVFILYFLLISDWYGRGELLPEYTYNLELFKEINRFWTYREQLGDFVVFANLAGNVIIFIPFGFTLPMASKYRDFITTCGYSFLVSLIVELFQLVTRVGSFDVDDLLLNTLGGALGYIIMTLCCIFRRINVKKKN